MGMQWRGYITAGARTTATWSAAAAASPCRSFVRFADRLAFGLNGDFGLYVQDTWQLGRLTLNPGLRFERFNAEVAEQTSPAGRFVGERHFDRIPNLPNFIDWVPRFGAAYDLTGNGKTGLKFSVGRYMEQDASAFPERTTR
jgi:outer membrane receptor for Fe3+-dicitrate